jgi:hypothetical protein
MSTNAQIIFKRQKVPTPTMVSYTISISISTFFCAVTVTGVGLSLEYLNLCAEKDGKNG